MIAYAASRPIAVSFRVSTIIMVLHTDALFVDSNSVPSVPQVVHWDRAECSAFHSWREDRAQFYCLNNCLYRMSIRVCNVKGITMRIWNLCSERQLGWMCGERCTSWRFRRGSIGESYPALWSAAFRPAQRGRRPDLFGTRS